MNPRTRRAIADVAAGIAAATVFLLCTLGILSAHGYNLWAVPEQPTSQTTTTTTTTDEVESTESTQYTPRPSSTPSAVPPGSTTTTTTPATTKTTETTTPVPLDTSWWGRILQTPLALVIFEFLLAAVAAFLAGAAVQRVILGSYGLRIGGVELEAVAPVTEVDARKADVVVDGTASPTAPPTWAVLPHELYGEDRIAVLHQRVALELLLRKAAQSKNIESDELTFLTKRLGAHGLDRQQVSGIVKLIKLGDRVSKGADLAGNSPELLLEAYNRAMETVAGLGTFELLSALEIDEPVAKAKPAPKPRTPRKTT